ncbi:toxic anion resistance protein [Ideonella sp. DXS29W]|uniref:Toxic anion resistance protein n=1 Tax=Ideonella lacteola TaxID=2984193 RepID=A0ABU9BSE0_9BURK
MTKNNPHHTGLTSDSAATEAPQDFTLEPPRAVAAIPPESASGRVKLKPDEVAALDAQVQGFIEEITTHDLPSPAFRAAVARIHALGTTEIEASAAVSNRLLERPVRSLNNGLLVPGSDIGQGLIQLRRQIEELDPARQGDLLRPRKLLGLIPFGQKLVDYFDRYQSSQAHLNAIIESLRRGKDELLRDNAAIEQEKANLWTLMERLEKYIHVGRQLDGALAAQAMALDATDADKARVVREEMLFYTRQKVQDLLTQMSVNIQGYLALDVVRKNNLELIKGVDRATTTTVSALRTAVIVAQALANQKLVLDQIGALHSTTGHLIAHTSQMLRDQGTAIHQQAVSATVDLDQLKQAFQNVYAAMDAIAEYKVKALASMQTTVDTLAHEVSQAQHHLGRVRQQEAPARPAALAREVRL